jgi:hypothetical protein
MTIADEKPVQAAASEIDVSIIIPCYNEQETVAICVTKALGWLERSGTKGEVVVVDNASSDATTEVALAAGARVLYEGLRGKGNAFQTGVRESHGRYIVMSDGDATYDLSNLDDMVEPLKQGYDMVIGNRLSGNMESKSMPWLHRHVGNPLFNALISLIARQRMGDVLSGLRSFTREAWVEMAPVSEGFELESEMCLRAGRHHLTVKDVPISYAVRQAPSKLRGFTHGWAIARFIMMESADLVLIVPGLLAILLGVICLASGVAASKGVDVGSVKWQPVFAGGILIPGGISLITVGVTAKWLAWQRGVARPGRVVRLLTGHSTKIGDWLLIAAVGSFLAGGALDAYLLFRWADGDPESLALGLGAVAQTLMLSGISLAVAAVLTGVLRASAHHEDRPRRPRSLDR